MNNPEKTKERMNVMRDKVRFFPGSNNLARDNRMVGLNKARGLILNNRSGSIGNLLT